MFFSYGTSFTFFGLYHMEGKFSVFEISTCVILFQRFKPKMSNVSAVNKLENTLRCQTQIYSLIIDQNVRKTFFPALNQFSVAFEKQKM